MSELYLNKYSIKQIYKNNTATGISGRRKILTYDPSIKGQYFKISISDEDGKVIVFEINDGTINLIRVNGINIDNLPLPPIIYTKEISSDGVVTGIEVGIDLGGASLSNVKIYIQASNSINNTYHNFDVGTSGPHSSGLMFRYEGSNFESTYRASEVVGPSTSIVRSSSTIGNFFLN